MKPLLSIPLKYIILLLFGCICSSVGANPDISQLSKEMIPVRVVTEHLPPFQVGNGKVLVGGENFEFLSAVFARAGISSRFELMPWARAYKTATDRKNTFIFSIVRTPSRESHFIWVAKLNDVNYSIFVSSKRRDINIQSIDDSLRYVAAVVRDTYEVELMQQHGFEVGHNLVQVSNFSMLWSLLDSGRVDFTISSAQQLTHEVEDRFKIIKNTRFNASMYLAANPETDAELISKVKTALRQQIAQSSFGELLNPELPD